MTESTAVVPFTLGELTDLGKHQMMGIAEITSKITSTATCGDLDKVGVSLGKLLLQAKDYDPNHFHSGLFHLFAKTKQQLANHFATVDQQVEELAKQVGKEIDVFRRRIPELETMYAANQKYYTEIGDIIAAATKRVDEMQANPPAVDPNDPYSAQEIADWQSKIDYARKKIRDLEISRVLTSQQAPQIRMMQYNSASLAQKFDDIQTTTLPALKSSFALYIINMEQKKGAGLADTIDAATNEVIRANAAQLGQNTTAIQTSLNRSSITVETLEINQKALLDSLAEVDRIRQETRQQLEEERPRLEKLSTELAATLAKHQ